MSPPKPLEGDAFRDASSSGPRATPGILNGGVFSIYGDIPIDAPPEAVYDAILDIDKWKDWSTFVSEVEITSHPHSHLKNLKMMEGTNMIFHVNLTDTEKTTSREVCAHIGKLRTLADHEHSHALTHIRWDLHNATSMLPGYLLKAQRVNEIEDLGGGKTMYRTWETFAGWTAGHHKKRYEETLKDRFQDWCRDLKKYVEAKHAKQDVTTPATSAE
ncbi:hypothetical protein B0A55_09794 [Friedmanniomyces simplex]|uniref:Coenzyme Q-binding protein COQ10 START domain-containing protein n=1 Tax=Friedmanniomyces simplex TaxID=329884 RepID=A0A4U0WSJ1_9PEZI|nr:hypothetical protein B0A55_09794 [Friedmanniomyces simplex]